MKSFAILIGVTSMIVACSSSSGTPNGGGGGGDDTTTDGGGGNTDGSAGNPDSSMTGNDGGVNAGSYSLTIGPINVAHGQENTQCIVKRLNNPAAMHVGSIHNELGSLTHHLIVYRVNDTVEQTTPFDCKPFTETLNPAKGSPLMISQKKDDLLQLPDGVAYSIAADQMFRLEMHYINAGNTDSTVQATATFTPIADSAFKYEADFLFIGDPDISLPPNSQTTVGPIYFQVPASYATSNFFAITGHEHQFGTNVVVSTATSKTDTGTPVYDVPGWLWNEPKTVSANPPFHIPANGGFKFSCSWNNTSSSTVSFGESANNEMCFFWAYYYPSQGAKVCFHSDKTGGAGVDFCCPGSSYCSLIPGQ